MSLRVTGGVLRGRGLRSPRGVGVRPTSARVREALFSVVGQRLDGARVLDLCAGAGTLGLEAGSRGAAVVVFVERERAHLPVLRANAALLPEGAAEVLALDAQEALPRLARRGDAFDLVLVDPPYGQGAAAELIGALAAHPALLREGGRVVVETDAREALPETLGLLARDPARRYGDTVLWLYRRTDEA